ncbi:formyltransferase family protein [Halovivax cerinus]|uniref:Formyltransferase family protein n=1 Tax=Halovivax cerinus TaxID=1487865 RepID=A0ABD5NPY0_9EURY|nr:formyltransferase family protein [Halovivax cerinus]
MLSDIDIVFLANSSSNKSKEVLECFSSEWAFENTCVKVVTDARSGKAVSAARDLTFPISVCDDPSEVGTTINEVTDKVSGCDYLISIGWSHRVPDEALAIPETAALNVHSSYLPRYRGLSVHRAQWANAEAEGGVTVHEMTSEFDEGDIIAQQKYRIGLFETPLDMVTTIGELAAALTREAILLLEMGYTGEEQKGEGNYYSLLPWSTVLKYGIVNHVLRLLRTNRRVRVPSGQN